MAPFGWRRERGFSSSPRQIPLLDLIHVKSAEADRAQHSVQTRERTMTGRNDAEIILQEAGQDALASAAA